MLHRNRQALRALRALALLAVPCLGLIACAPPLLSPDEKRTQFDSYDSLRNQQSDQYIYDEYGRRRPDLKHRLSPKD
jgi:hypothetical protein